MGIAQGTPINTQGVHPFAALMGEGTRNFAMGASLASAKMNQDQQGLNAFLRDSVKNNMLRKQQEMEEKRFNITTGIKLDEAAKNRALQEKQINASISIAAARESRMAAEAEAKAEQQRMVQEVVGGMFAGGLPTGGLPTGDSPVGQRFGGGSNQTAGVSLDGGAGLLPPRNVDEPLAPQPSAQPDISGLMAAGNVSKDDFNLSNETFPEREIAEQTGHYPPEKLDEAFDLRISNMQRVGQLYGATNNLSGAISMFNQISELQFERAQLLAAGPEGQAETLAILGTIRSQYDPLAHLAAPGPDRAEYVEQLKHDSQPVYMTELSEGDLGTYLRESPVSASTLGAAITIQEAKINTLAVQRGAMTARLYHAHGVKSEKIMEGMLAHAYKAEERKMDALVEAHTSTMKQLNLANRPAATLAADLDDTRAAMDATQMRLSEIGSEFHEKGGSNLDKGPWEVDGEMGKTLAVIHDLRKRIKEGDTSKATNENLGKHINDFRNLTIERDKLLNRERTLHLSSQRIATAMDNSLAPLRGKGSPPKPDTAHLAEMALGLESRVVGSADLGDDLTGPSRHPDNAHLATNEGFVWNEKRGVWMIRNVDTGVSRVVTPKEGGATKPSKAKVELPSKVVDAKGRTEVNAKGEKKVVRVRVSNQESTPPQAKAKVWKEMTVDEFAKAKGLGVAQLNLFNGTTLRGDDIMTKGSELRVAPQPSGAGMRPETNEEAVARNLSEMGQKSKKTVPKK